MANSLKGSMDTSEWDKVFENLRGPAKESLARRMSVAGGRVLRDEAVLLAPILSGRLKNAIYVAHNKKISSEYQQVYSVSWNRIKAPHGHLVEFGYYQRYLTVKINGNVYSIKSKPLATPIRIPGSAFLRRAFDAKLPEAKNAMITAGRENIPILFKGQSGDTNEL